MRRIILIAHNLRSSHNVGSLLRTAEGLGVETVYLTGNTPYPRYAEDRRLPHIAAKVDRQIAKPALGAEKTLSWCHRQQIEPLIDELRRENFAITALEQGSAAVKLPAFAVPGNVALVVGREVEGIEPEILALCDKMVEIPMSGQKESFNVVQAAAMALYHIRFMI